MSIRTSLQLKNVLQPTKPLNTTHCSLSTALKNTTNISTFHTLKGSKRFAHTDLAPPSFDFYRRKSNDYRSDADRSKTFTYLMSGAATVAAAASAKSMVYALVGYMAASADVLALAKVEVNLQNIPEGSTLSVMWRGKPLFIRHRTQSEIDEANDIDISVLRDPETDSQRVKDPKFLIMIGVCTHLGCIPVGEAGDYGGWFCPCHGSHYDISGRIRKGPAPLNLEIPPYEFIENDTMAVVG